MHTCCNDLMGLRYDRLQSCKLACYKIKTNPDQTDISYGYILIDALQASVIENKVALVSGARMFHLSYLKAQRTK